MKAKGQSAKKDDVVPYIFCLPADGESAKSAKAGNAHHPDDVRRQGSTLKIGKFVSSVFESQFEAYQVTFPRTDFEVYLASQVLPPIERLCEHIEGTEKARLAECLGASIVCLFEDVLSTDLTSLQGST
jgi:DNA polymerase alpha subunit A